MTTSQSHRISSVTKDELPALLRLIRGLAEYEKRPEQVAATVADLEAAIFGARPIVQALLAYVGNETNAGDAVGMAIFHPTFSTFSGRPGMYLEDIFVEPEWRGQGIGKRLLAAVARAAVEQGCQKLSWTVLHWNTPAIEFYKKLGAKHIDEWATYALVGKALEAVALSGG